LRQADEALRNRLRELASEHRRFECCRLGILLARRGFGSTNQPLQPIARQKLPPSITRTIATLA
jgi:hypothetical protein